MTITANRQASPIGAFVELLKPITWFPPMWAFGCGVVSAGVTPESGDFARIALGVLLAGPLVCGASQVINDWFDRDVDAINEPGRPIPSGRIPGRWGLLLGIGWSALSLLVSAFLGLIVFAATLIALALAWAYSAPPLRLKLNGWWGNAACGLCYEGLAWVTGAALMLGGLPPPRILALAALYSIAAHGIMTLNDFKSIEGDRISGIGSLPVRMGPSAAALVACAMMVVPQIVVVALLDLWGHVPFAGLITLSLALQVYCMRRLLLDPRRYAPWYNATGVSLLVLGMLVAAIAVR
jgi:chlorophyll synthase